MPENILIAPLDSYNQTLLANAHPADWVNPKPAPRYNLVVLGAGTAGLVCAAGAAGLGAKVALVEKHLMGGDCLAYGCVPSKALLRAARAMADVRDAENFGVRVPAGVSVDFPAVMERMRRLRAYISPHDSAARFRSLGVDVFLGEGRFTGVDSIVVNGQTLRFRKAVIATGARPVRPVLPGLAETGFLTNETVFSLTALPRRLAVVGAGPLGCELAQAFARFGSQVILIGKHPRIMPREDPDASQIVDAAMRRDGIRLLLGHEIRGVERCGMDKVLHLHDPQRAAGLVPAVSSARSTSESPSEFCVDEILVGVGREPNVLGLNLEAANIAYDPRIGVHVSDRLQTTNPRIYAAGDVCSEYKFTHAAYAMARIVIQNALFLGRARVSALTIPWCTYTDPEIAHVGLNEAQARDRGIAVQTFVEHLEDVDRAILDGETDGFVKIHLRKGSNRIVGATIVARHAGDMISEITLALVGKLGMKTLANTIHPYPTQAEAIKKVADAYSRSRLTPRIKSLFEKWLRWCR